jgi:protein MpaA
VDGTTVELGRSIEGRPILVHRRGTPGGVAVLVVGVIHGDEDAGAAIVDRLLRDPVPDGVDLWVVPSMNPDGQAAQRRHNAAGVDLNRNFPERWGPIAAPGDWQYAGPAPASEPETRAMLGLTALVAPDLVLWYHQDLFRISPATGLDGEVRARYAELTGLPLLEVSGGTYTGTASIWSRSITAPDGVGFTVELGSDLSDEDASRHAAAVFAVAAEFFGR